MHFDTEQFKLFKLIYENKSLSEAAKRYPMSISKASRQLAKMRDNFGGRELFIRASQGLFPTQYAQDIYPRIKQILNDISSLQELQTFSPEKLQRTFSIGCLDIDIVAVFSPLSASLRETAPGVKIHFKNYDFDFYSDLRQGVLDFVLYPMSEVFTGYKKCTLGRDSFVYVSKSDSKFAIQVRNGNVLREKDLTDHLISQPTVPVLNDENTYLGVFTEDVGTCKFDTRFFTPFFTGSPFFLQGDDTTVIPLQTAVRMAKYMPIEILGRPKNLPDYPYTIIWEESRGSDPAHQWFRSWLLSESQKNFVDVDSVPRLI